jgi:hypothetical protein
VGEGEDPALVHLALSGNQKEIKAVEAETVAFILWQYDHRASAFSAVPEHVCRVLKGARVLSDGTIISSQILTPF